jgi:hypothetical protein
MKKVLSVVLAIAMVMSVMGVALAGPGAGKGMGMAQGANLTPEQQQKFAQFQKDVLPLKQKMMALKTDLTGLKAQQTPDWKAIADKEKEMVDVRTEIQKKASEAGFPGMGMGKGKGMRGKGMCMQ